MSVSTPVQAPGREAVTKVPRREAYVRAAQIVLTVIFGALAVGNVIGVANGWLRDYPGLDFNHYVDGARRWVETGTPYLANEVAGPFSFSNDSFLHPPIALILFAPFLVLPAFLYWAIPLVGTVAIMASWRPARWTWPVIALLLNWPRFGGALAVGNSDLWVAFFIALGLRFAWPVVLLAIKPSVAPIGVIALVALAGTGGMTSRRLIEVGVATIALFVVALPFGTLWLDWLAVVRNSPADLFYSLGGLPWLIVPGIAWLGRARA